MIKTVRDKSRKDAHVTWVRDYDAGGVLNSGGAWLQGSMTIVTPAASETKWNKLARIMDVCTKARRTRGVSRQCECDSESAI